MNDVVDWNQKHMLHTLVGLQASDEVPRRRPGLEPEEIAYINQRIAAIPKMLPNDPAARQEALEDIRRILTASGELQDEKVERLARIEALFADTA